jgi:hypothetical protein
MGRRCRRVLVGPSLYFWPLGQGGTRVLLVFLPWISTLGRMGDVLQGWVGVWRGALAGAVGLTMTTDVFWTARVESGRRSALQLAPDSTARRALDINTDAAAL